jgi:hypothetical protein
MSSSVYLTAININENRDTNNEQTEMKSFSPNKSVHDPTGKNTPQAKSSCFLTKNHEKFEKTTSMMLDYLVNEETHYTDMIKIEDYFKNKTIEDYKIYNTNLDEIKKKREMLKMMESHLNEVGFYKFSLIFIK